MGGENVFPCAGCGAMYYEDALHWEKDVPLCGKCLERKQLKEFKKELGYLKAKVEALEVAEREA